jgi:hypothetical protein
MRPDELKRRLQARLDALGPAPRAELLNVLMLPDFDRADAIGSYWGNPKTRTFGELLIDCEEDRVLRAVLIGLLRVREEALSLLREQGHMLAQSALADVVNAVSDAVVGMGPIEYLLKDPEVTEVTEGEYAYSPKRSGCDPPMPEDQGASGTDPQTLGGGQPRTAKGTSCGTNGG